MIFFFGTLYRIYLVHVTAQIEWESRMSQNLQWWLYYLGQLFKIILRIIQRAEVLQWSREQSQRKVRHEESSLGSSMNPQRGLCTSSLQLLLQDTGWHAQLLCLHWHTCALMRTPTRHPPQSLL